jgi:nucleotide-binding universal stress UspA family protein
MPQDSMIRTILVATDGSSHADMAVSLGGELAQAHDAKIILLHVISDIGSEIGEGIPKHLQELADIEHLKIGEVLTVIGEEILERARAQLREQGVEKIVTAMPSGSPAQAILDNAKAHSVDLIVMGSRGLSSFEGLMLGSVSHKVSHLAPCSCLTVR